MRKLMLILAVVALGLAGCGQSESANTAAPEAAGTTAVTTENQQHPAAPAATTTEVAAPVAETKEAKAD